jgi:hypothetical protein
MDWPFRMRARVVVAGCIALLRAKHSRGYSFGAPQVQGVEGRRVRRGAAAPPCALPDVLGGHRSAHTPTRAFPHLFHFGGRRRGTCGVAFLRQYSGGAPQGKAPKRQLLRGSPRATSVRTYLLTTVRLRHGPAVAGKNPGGCYRPALDVVMPVWVNTTTFAPSHTRTKKKYLAFFRGAAQRPTASDAPQHFGAQRTQDLR